MLALTVHLATRASYENVIQFTKHILAQLSVAMAVRFPPALRGRQFGITWAGSSDPARRPIKKLSNSLFLESIDNFTTSKTY